MLQLEALNGQLEDQLDLRRLRKEPCLCPTEEVASAGDGNFTSVQCARRVEALETFVVELKDTNRILVETLSELESEAQKRVRLMEQVLERTAHAAKSYMVELAEYERTTRNALRDKLKYLAVIEKLGGQVSRLERGKSEVQDHCDNLTHDIASLVRLVDHARNTGQWDIGNIDFCELTCKQVFGSIDKLDSWSADLDRIDNPAFDSISAVQVDHNASYKALSIPDRPASVFSQSSVRTIGESGSGGRVTRRDADIHRLQVELRHSQKQLTTMQSELSQRDRMIADLQVQICDLNHEMSLKDSECFVHHNHQQLRQHFPGADHGSATPASSPNAATSYANELVEYHSGAFRTFKRDGKERSRDAPLRSASQATSDSGLDMRNDPHRLHETVAQLQALNEGLSRDCRRLTERLEERDEELRVATERCSRLEKELGDVERVWQELDACKEDGELIRTELESERQEVRQLRKALGQRREEEERRPRVVGCAAQTDVTEENAELERLSRLELRHRLKASGLEMVVGQLQGQLRALNDEKDNHPKQNGLYDHGAQVADVNDSERVDELEETVRNLRQELSVILEVVDHKNSEIDNQKLTIRNLQEAVVSMKRTSPAAAPPTNGSTSDGPATTNGSAVAAATTATAAAMASKLSQSRDILHI